MNPAKKRTYVLFVLHFVNAIMEKPANASIIMYQNGTRAISPSAPNLKEVDFSGLIMAVPAFAHITAKKRIPMSFTGMSKTREGFSPEQKMKT